MKTDNERLLTAAAVRNRLAGEANPARAKDMRRFFKTGPGEYAEGDVFWGIASARVRAAAACAESLDLSEVERLLQDEAHEVRACGLVIMTERFKRAGEADREALIALYLRRTDRINNWDLVDISAAMLGQWLADRPRDVLCRLAGSPCLWEQRIAVVATLPLIRQKDFSATLALAEKLRDHPHDLMHKAVGWMLREVGKQDKAALEAFLERHVRRLPRTTLRYAIERFPEAERKAWLRR